MDTLVTCPYDSSHRILPHRLQVHLAKCSKNHPFEKMRRCPFDATHIIPHMEYEHHVATCESSANNLNSQYTFEPDRTLSTVPYEEFEKVGNVSSSENWNTEPTYTRSYDPLNHIQNKNIIRPLICASKSKKKQFKREERLRIESLENTSKLLSEKTLRDDKEEPEKPLRPPKNPAKALLNVGSSSISDAHTSVNKSLRENETCTNSQNVKCIKKDSSTLKMHTVSKEELNISNSDLKINSPINVVSKDNTKFTQNNKIENNASSKYSFDAEIDKIESDASILLISTNKKSTKVKANEHYTNDIKDTPSEPFENINPYCAANLSRNIEKSGTIPKYSTGRGHILACKTYKKYQELNKNVGLYSANNPNGSNKEILKKETKDVHVTSKPTDDNMMFNNFEKANDVNTSDD